MPATTRIRFIGQCLLRGYPGVSRDEVFAAVAAHRLKSSRGQARVAISAGEFYHPLQLSRQVDRTVGRADVVVIDVAGLPVATAPDTIDMSRLPRWVVAVDDRIRHLRELRYQLSVAYPRGERFIELVVRRGQCHGTTGRRGGWVVSGRPHGDRS